MANNKMTGIIFSNSHDDALGGLTARRSMGSVPFASRYRLIDLVLSRMSHAGCLLYTSPSPRDRG